LDQFTHHLAAETRPAEGGAGLILAGANGPMGWAERGKKNGVPCYGNWTEPEGDVHRPWRGAPMGFKPLGSRHVLARAGFYEHRGAAKFGLAIRRTIPILKYETRKPSEQCVILRGASAVLVKKPPPKSFQAGPPETAFIF